MRRIAAALCIPVLLTACAPVQGPSQPPTGSGITATSVPVASSPSQPVVPIAKAAGVFGSDVSYKPTGVQINPAIAQDFSLNEVTQLAAFEKAYGFTFTPAEKDFLLHNKFVIKNLTETNIRPVIGKGGIAEYYREFVGLYNGVSGNFDYKTRAPQNALFYGPDVFLNLYNILFTELLKEMENKEFYPSMRALSSHFYTAADEKVKATAGKEQAKWMKVRNYFAIPHAILSTAAEPPAKDGYSGQDPNQVMADFQKTDGTVDTYANVSLFVQKLHLDAQSEKDVLEELDRIYKAKGRQKPVLFAAEYDDYAKQTNVGFQLDYTQFTPRSHYTSSSLRRQYFRAMTWYIQVAFFLKSPALTEASFAMAQLMAEHPDDLTKYSELESTINFLVGASDDLMPVDYLEALNAAKGATDKEKATMEYLVAARQPKIKSIPATYGDVGVQKTADVLLKTKGMHFFSGKFILDSYWTGQLTQGDEAPKPGYTQKLPPMASSLEVMALLGSDYARTQIPHLDFYKPETSQAIEKAMNDLAAETSTLTDTDWQANIYSTALWTIKSLFSWPKANHASLPSFMQSQFWDVKTLMTASAFWTEMRHATLLYAKQSFAELGGGGDLCDTRQVPEPAKGYIEPQLEAYDRLGYLAERTQKGLKDQGFSLTNDYALSNFVELIHLVRDYAAKELVNTAFTEKIVERRDPDPENPGKTCISHWIEGDSDWEKIRMLVRQLESALPQPVEGAVLTAKDKRNALLADVHTGGDSAHPPEVLYEGTGIPKVIFVAVKDANGPRLTVGFISSHYEFQQPYGDKRLTDEDWQKRFYTGDDAYNPYQYTDAKQWPAPNFWYKPILELK